MNNWFQVKVKYTKEFQDGTLKRVTEPYLVQAISFSEAEDIIHKEVGEFIRGEFVVQAIDKYDIADIFMYDDCETWFKVRTDYITEDADSGKEKKVVNDFLVNADSTKEAESRIDESLKGLIASYKVSKIEETGIVDLIIQEEQKKPSTKPVQTEED